MRRPSIVVRALVIVLALLLEPSTAHAHLGLRRSDPDSNATLQRSPAAITLWFTQRPQLGFTRVALSGPDGAVPLGGLAADTANAVRASLPAPLAPGEYTVQWQTASADGHPIRGTFRFRVLATPDAAVPSGPVNPATHGDHRHTPQPEAHEEHPLYRGVRWLEFVALVTILGVVGFHHLVLPALASRQVSTAEPYDRARRLGQQVVVLYALAALVRLYSESRVIHGAEALNAELLRRMVFQTTWGTGWMAGMIGALLVAVGWRLAKHKRAGATIAATAGAVAVSISPPLSGHAAASSQVAASVALDAAHVATAGIWIGGLLVVLFAGIPALIRSGEGAHAAIAGMVHSFHPVALFCVPVVVLSGLGSAWLRLGSPAALFGSRYGLVLVVKLLLVLCLAALGMHNSVRARRRLGTAEATRDFRITAWSEVAIGAAVLAATTMLIITPPPAMP